VAAAGRDESTLLQLAKGSPHRPSGETQVGGQLTYRGEALPGGEQAGRDHGGELTANLFVGRDR
jgi:hypothetical protein